MKFQKTLIIIIILLLPGQIPAQDVGIKVLLTVNGTDITAGEFIRMFRKSYDSVSTKGLDNYLQEYINFKLKVADAINEGFDTTRAFKTELNGYRNELAVNYLTDNDLKEKLLQQAYKRSLNEVKAWHILISCAPDASPEDTLKAYNKAFDIRERIIKGEPFEQVARGASEDPSVTTNGGNLGYFSVFQTIMPFEDAVYKLKKGEISMPVRTPYGYHIIKLEDKRASRGQIKVAHIMKSIPVGAGSEESQKAEQEINAIYKQLTEGASFEELAKKMSDDKESAVKGGELNWFSAGEIITEFSEAAFSLKNNGDFTKPVRTFYGWHIIKSLDKKDPGSYEESKKALESKISQSYLNTVGRQSLANKLRTEYKFKINSISFDWFVNNTDTLIMQGLSKYIRADIPAGYIYTFANQRLSNRNFADFISGRTATGSDTTSLLFINSMIRLKSTEDILEYENTVLENKYPEFRYLMNEFHDGMLLFEISGERVWNKVSTDSIGLRKYYEIHKKEFLTKPAIEAKIYSLNKKDGINQLDKTYKKNSGKLDCDSRMISKFNKNNDSLLTITSGKYYRGDNQDLDNIDWKTGVHEAKIKNIPSLIVINKIYNAEPLPLKMVENEMVTGYQQQLEADWIKQLKENYSVKINSPVLEEIRKIVNNE
jgi:peptidyl-prolyl cis-trans isomerase SurA